MIFWIAVTGLLVLALLILVLPVLKIRAVDEGGDRQQQNIDIAREKKSTLELQFGQGELNQDEYDSGLLDLQTALALDLENIESGAQPQQGKWAIWLLAAIVPLLSLGLYFQLGEYRVIEDPSIAELASAPAQNQHSNLSLEEILTLLKQRLREKPEDSEGWYVLGKTLMAQQKFDQAVTAFQRTYDLVGKEPGVMFSLADALAMQNNGAMQGEPEQLVKSGLEISPQNPTGLWMAGMAASQRQDYKGAYALWTRLLPLIQSDQASSAEVRELIQNLKRLDPELAASESVSQVLNLSVNLSQELRQLTAPEDSVFVYAKAMAGPPMPLAVKRLTVRDLPAEVILSNDDAMIPSMTLSTFPRVIVGARISKSGNPVAQPGDLFIEIAGVDSAKPPESMVLLINQIK